MKKNKEKRIYGNIFILILAISITILLSFILGTLQFGTQLAEISNGFLQTTLTTVQNILSKEGILYLINNTIANYRIIEPLVLLLISFMSVSILKSSGLLEHLVKPLKKVKTEYIVFLTIFICSISTLFGNYSYIILLPLNALIYSLVGRSPILGLIATFIGIASGYGSGLIYDYNYYLMGLATESAASFEIDSSYKFNLLSNFYIMLSSTVIVSIALTYVIKDKLENKYSKIEEAKEVKYNDKALLKTTIASTILLGLLTYSIIPNLPLSGLLLDESQTNYIAMLFGVNSPFYNGFMTIAFSLIFILSLVYGYTSKKFKTTKDISDGLTCEFKNIGYVFVILFFATIFIEIVEWSNLGTVITSLITNLLSNLQFSGILLIITLFIATILMSIIMPSTIAKWNILSPLVIPLFMRANITPEFTQFIFAVADGIGKIISPTYIYFYLFIGLLNMYKKEEEISFKNIFKDIIPVFLLIALIWLLIIMAWYIVGIPLGIGTTTIL